MTIDQHPIYIFDSGTAPRELLPAALHSAYNGGWVAECPLMLCCDTDENVPPWCNDIHDRAPGSAACDHHYHTSSRQLSAPLAGDGGDGDNVMKRCHSLWSRMQTRRGSDVWRYKNGECSFEYSTFSWMKVPSESFKMLLCWKSLCWQLGCLYVHKDIQWLSNKDLRNRFLKYETAF